MKTKYPLYLSCLLPLATTPALAQNQTDTETVTITEIVVTARRAEESLQKVPLSITALGANDLQAAGISSVEDIAALTPGFSFRNGLGRGFERPVIRGMSNISGTANASFFIDGIYVNGPISGYNIDNLERVEVIRGPQSALFGRSTFSGAINYVTRKPTDEFEGRIEATTGNYNRQNVSLWASGPIIDGVLRFQVNGSYYNRDGQYLNLASGEKDVGGERTRSFGGSLSWTPVEWFDATLRANYAYNDDEQPAIVRLGGPGTGYSANDVRNCYQPAAGTRRRGYFCGEAPTPDHVWINTHEFNAAGIEQGQQTKLFRSSLVMNAYLSDYTLTSTTSWDRITDSLASDQDYSAERGFGGAFETLSETGQDVWSQELRIASPRDRRLRWQAGLYTYENNPDTTALSAFLVDNPAAGQPDFPAVFTTQGVDSSTKNEAAFAMVEFDLTDQLTLTAEGRYAKDTIHTGGNSVYSKSANTGFIPGSYSANCVVANTPNATSPNRQTLTCANPYLSDVSFKNFLPRFTATWLGSDTMTYYAQYAKGNKPGGFNADSQNARIQPTDRDNLRTLGLQSFEEEEADSYEIGLKSQWFDRRLQVNTALYFIDWTNQQLTQTAPVAEEGRAVGAAAQPQFLTSYTSNLGKSQIRGVETEMLAALGQHWDLRLTYAYQDAEIKRYISSDQSDLIFAGPYTGCVSGSQCYADYLAAGDLSGNTLPRVPKHLASASISANYPIGSWGTLSWRTDYSYESSRYVQVDNLMESGDSNVVNMRLGLDVGAWNVTAWVDNLTDDDTSVDTLRTVDPTIFLTVPVQPPLPGTLTATNARDFAVTLPLKRMYGITVGYKF
jgi:outer membrane receptor protein involved in Fe transport